MTREQRADRRRQERRAARRKHIRPMRGRSDTRNRRRNTRARGPKSPAERVWRRAFEGIHVLHDLQAANTARTEVAARPRPMSPSSGAAKRRRRGRRSR